MMGKKTMSELRKKLLQRREDILEFRRNLNTSWQSLHEPEKEMEEAASKENVSRGLEQLDSHGWDELRAIDEALAKMDEGEYGTCESCRRPITVKRLRAVPWARHCVRCASSRESFARGGIEARPVSPGKEQLTDEEIQENIFDALYEDGQVETEELDITCEDGVVYLEGVLPSEAQHEILLEIVNDILDFNETVDNLTIDRQPWERRERSRTPVQGKQDKEIMMEGEDEQVDVYTSLAEGEPMTPPDELEPEGRRSGKETA